MPPQLTQTPEIPPQNRIMRAISGLTVGSAFVGVLGFGLLAIFMSDTTWLFLTILCFVNLLMYAAGYQAFTTDGSKSLLLWRSPLGCIVSLLLGQLLIGPQLIIILPMLACFTVMLSLVQVRFVLAAAVSWVVFSLILYLSQYYFGIYTPPIMITKTAEVITNLFTVALVSPILLWLLIVPGKMLAQSLQLQNQSLQTLLEAKAHSEDLLRESEQRLRDTFEHAAVGMCQMDMRGNWLFVNQTMCDMLGYSREELLKLTIAQITYPDDVKRFDSGELMARRGTTPRTVSTEKRYVRKDGSIMWARLTVSTLFDEDCKPSHIVGVVDDITAQKQAQAQVAFQATVLDQIRNVVMATDTTGNIIYYNKAARAVFSTKDELKGRSISNQFAVPYNKEQIEGLLQNLMTTGRAEAEFIGVKLAPDRAFFVTASSLRDATGELTGFVGVATDISERRQVEQALAAEKERLDVTLRSIGDGVITTDTEGRITLLNSTAETFTGWSHTEGVGQLLPDVFQVVDNRTNQPVVNPAQRVFQTGQIVGLPASTVLVARDGVRRFISSSAAPIRDQSGQVNGVVLVFRDVTERFRMEEELRKTQKLESLGILAGGIAHDFNNILTAIVGNIGLAKLETSPDAPQYELLDEAEAASLRASGLTRQLLTFSKGGAPLKKTASLKELLRESATFALRGSNVRCGFELAPDLWAVEIDVGQISQVINNLVINADQAMPNGGQLEIRAKNVYMTVSNCRPSLEPGDYVQVTVQDAGGGIAPSDISRIFDPYFTTKEQGNGLGLATSYSIIARHAGCIEVESEFGCGTTFTIYLPASKKDRPLAESSPPTFVAGSGTILLMDDDKALRELGTRAMQRLGYQVETVNDGGAAIRHYQERLLAGQPFDLVIMDLTVPGGMGGQEAMTRLIEIDPNIRAIVSSGYSNDPVMANYRRYHFREVLIKPFQLEELSRKIEKVLHQS